MMATPGHNHQMPLLLALATRLRPPQTAHLFQPLAKLLPPARKSQALAMQVRIKLLLPALAIQGHNHMTPLLVAPVTLRVLLQLAKLLPPA
jgi:hypothetical protein